MNDSKKPICKYIKAFTLLWLCLMCFSCSGRPAYVTKWHLLKLGMTKTEVRTIIGNPHAISEPIKVETSMTEELPRHIATTVVAKTVFKESKYERWAYGEFGVLDNFLTPDDRAYVVYFNENGVVTKLRLPGG